MLLLVWYSIDSLPRLKGNYEMYYQIHWSIQSDTSYKITLDFAQEDSNTVRCRGMRMLCVSQKVHLSTELCHGGFLIVFIEWICAFNTMTSFDLKAVL
jgi:hypothetical protein